MFRKSTKTTYEIHLFPEPIMFFFFIKWNTILVILYPLQTFMVYKSKKTWTVKMKIEFNKLGYVKAYFLYYLLATQVPWRETKRFDLYKKKQKTCPSLYDCHRSQPYQSHLYIFPKVITPNTFSWCRDETKLLLNEKKKFRSSSQSTNKIIILKLYPHDVNFLNFNLNP